MSKARKVAHSSEDTSSSTGSSSSLSSDEEVDARDLKPIKEYMSDRREMARQLFKSVNADKIQMMLPESLKKIDFIQLEKWCATELSGMSKRRILCILNGKPMLESSDTNESDDSGPSLEIISDTEEWFTDEDTCKQEDGSKPKKGKFKNERMKHRRKSLITKKNESKCNPNKVSDNLNKNVQVKKEEDLNKGKEKEGDSLLDLLELEMRARAIRALIRKEEDIIPNTSKSTTNNDANAKAASKAEQEEIKEKENCRRQIEKIISAQQGSTAEDEDVVLVVQPTPTIELLSSESEGESHSGVRVNKKLQNERVIETKDNNSHIENRELNSVHNVDSTNNSKEDETLKTTTKIRKDADATNKIEIVKRAHNNNASHKDSHKRRKMKRKSHAKEEPKSTNSEANTSNNDSHNEVDAIVAEDSKTVKLNDKKHDNSVKSNIGNSDSSSDKKIAVQSGVAVKVALDEEKSTDFDEIIDLDDYCDDMEDMETSENDRNKNVQNVANNQCKTHLEVKQSRKTNGAETWASRYYQTDDVQNVIKESKIQSEIRKRLRERQRLSKLSTSPNKNLPSSPPVAEAVGTKPTENDPMGSVDEYLALKHIVTTNSSTTDSNNDPHGIKNSAASADTRTNSPIDNSTIRKIDKEIDSNGGTNTNSLVAMKTEHAINPMDTAKSV